VLYLISFVLSGYLIYQSALDLKNDPQSILLIVLPASIQGVTLIYYIRFILDQVKES
jgi:hypothetical protein